jgi:hypothetical protein
MKFGENPTFRRKICLHFTVKEDVMKYLDRKLTVTTYFTINNY